MAVSIPILMFHSLDELASPLSFPPELFRSGLRSLLRHGFQPLTVTEAAAWLARNPAPATRPLAVSFDDGYRSVYETALPVLRDLGCPATIYLSGPFETSELAAMQGRPRLTWDQIGALRESGFEIGAHSLSHPRLARLSGEELRAEIEGSRELLERRLGAPVSSFAYPYGSVSPAARELVSQRFRCACTTELAVATEGSDVYALPRLEMHYFRSAATFRLLSGSWLQPYLGLRRGPRAIRRRLLGT